MSNEESSATVSTPHSANQPSEVTTRRIAPRRSFLKRMGVAGTALAATALLRSDLFAEEKSGSLTSGDAALLRFLAAAEIIESDLWLQYTELDGTQDGEVPLLASHLIPGYPNTITGGSNLYTLALTQLDGDMPRYIRDNTEDELTHEQFINAYLASKAADIADLDPFRTFPAAQQPAPSKSDGSPT
jgi:hypothetical protein